MIVFITGFGPSGITIYPYLGPGVAMMAATLLLWVVAVAVLNPARLQGLRALSSIGRGAKRPVN